MMRRFPRAAAPRLFAPLLVLISACPCSAQKQREVKIDTGIQMLGKLAFSPDGKTLAYSTRQGQFAPALIVFCDAKTGKQTDRVELGRKSLHAPVLAYSPDGKSILAATGAGKVGDKGKYGILTAHVFDVAKMERTAHFEFEEGDGGDAEFAGDGKTLVVTSYFERGVALYDATTGKRVALIAGKHDRAERLAVSADGKWAATGHGPVGVVAVWDLAGRKLARTLRPSEQEEVRTVALSPKGESIAVINFREVSLWDAKTGKPIKSYSDRPLYNYLAFGPEGKSLIAAGGSRGTGVIVWDLATGAVAGESDVRGNSRRLNAASADGRLLATYHQTEGIRFWDLPSVEEVNGRKK